MCHTSLQSKADTPQALNRVAPRRPNKKRSKLCQGTISAFANLVPSGTRRAAKPGSRVAGGTMAHTHTHTSYGRSYLDIQSTPNHGRCYMPFILEEGNWLGTLEVQVHSSFTTLLLPIPSLSRCDASWPLADFRASRMMTTSFSSLSDALHYFTTMKGPLLLISVSFSFLWASCRPPKVSSKHGEESASPNYPLRHPKYHLVETIRPLVEVRLGV